MPAIDDYQVIERPSIRPMENNQDCAEWFIANRPSGSFCYIDKSHPDGRPRGVDVSWYAIELLYSHYALDRPDHICVTATGCMLCHS